MKLNENEKISVKEKLAYSMGYAANSIYGMILGSFLLSYYTDTVAINAIAISTMFLVVKILDMGSDFVVGALVDKTNSRLGKVRPWLLASSPMLAIALILLFCNNAGWSDSGKLVYAYLTYIFANVISYTIYGISQTSLLPKITMDSNERMSLSTWGNIFSNIASIAVGAVFLPMVIKIGWKYTAIILGIISGIMIFIEFLLVKERDGGEVEMKQEKKVSVGQATKGVLKNKYFIIFVILCVLLFMMQTNFMQAMVYYCNYILKDPLFVSALNVGRFPSLIVLLFTPLLTKKFSKQKLMIACTLMLLMSYVLICVAGTNRTLVMIGVLLNSVLLSPMFVFVVALLADFVDFNEYETGVRSAGIISSANSIGVKAGSALGAAMTGWILGAFGYKGVEAVQDAKAILGIKIAFGWIGIAFCVAILIILMFLNIEKKLPEMQRELRRRHETVGENKENQ